MAEPSPLQGWRLRGLALSIVAAAGLYLAGAAWSGFAQVRAALGAIGPIGLLVALGLSLLNYGLRYLRWQYYLQRLGHRMPTAASLAIYLGGFTLTTTPAKAGEAVRALFLRSHGVPYPQTFGALFAERLTDLLAVTALCLLGAWRYEPARVPIAVLGLLLVAAVAALRAQGALVALRARLARRPRTRTRKALGATLEVVAAAGRCFTAPALGAGLGLGVLAWAAEGLALYLFVTQAGGEIGVMEAQFIYAFALLVGAASLIPAGLGSTEVAMTALLTWRGMDPGAAVAVTVLLRLATLWFAVLVGAVSVGLYRHRPCQ